MNEKFKQELKEARSMADILKVCSKYYDLENAVPGALQKIALVSNIDKVLALANAKPKK